MEIERKFTLKSLPDNLESYPSHHIEQVYLNYNPVIRARKQDDEYYLTYKGSGMMARDESNLPLNEESYYHLREKADGTVALPDPARASRIQGRLPHTACGLFPDHRAGCFWRPLRSSDHGRSGVRK